MDASEPLATVHHRPHRLPPPAIAPCVLFEHLLEHLHGMSMHRTPEFMRQRSPATLVAWRVLVAALAMAANECGCPTGRPHSTGRSRGAQLPVCGGVRPHRTAARAAKRGRLDCVRVLYRPRRQRCAAGGGQDGRVQAERAGSSRGASAEGYGAAGRFLVWAHALCTRRLAPRLATLKRWQAGLSAWTGSTCVPCHLVVAQQLGCSHRARGGTTRIDQAGQ